MSALSKALKKAGKASKKYSPAKVLSTAARHAVEYGTSGKGLIGRANPLNPIQATGGVLKELYIGKGPLSRNLKENLALTRKAHMIQENPSNRKRRMYATAERMMKSSDPTEREQGNAMWKRLDKAAHRQAISKGEATIAAGLAAYGGEAALGGEGAGAGGGGAALEGGTYAGEAGAGVGTTAGGMGIAGEGAAAGTTTTGMSLGTKAALGIGAGLALSRLAPKAKAPAGAGIPAAATDVGTQLLDDYKTGKLEPADQAAIDGYVKTASEEMKQQLQNMGIADSTMAAEEMAKIEANGVTMYSQFRQQTIQNGLQALGLGTQAGLGYAQLQMQRDANLQSAYSNAASSAMMLMAML